MHSPSRPIRLAMTMGDPAGIGPEIAVKALTSPLLPEHVGILAIGDLSVLRRAASFVGKEIAFHATVSADDLVPQCVNVLDMKVISPDDFTVGVVSARSGAASYRYIIEGIGRAMSGEVCGVVTNPINKEALKAAGIDFPGHTEIFAHETNAKKFTMMFSLDNVAVVHVTTHCSLREAIDLISRDRVMDNIRLLNDCLKRLGIPRPRIAVGGLNPHAGEHGLFGVEEIREIAPAVAMATSEGIDVRGPFPPDTVFMRAFRGEFDGVVAMLHDHGFVALKSRDFEHGVNITVGLPIVRTSVGHGTAFDIAGTGQASEHSLISAIKAAAKLCEAR